MLLEHSPLRGRTAVELLLIFTYVLYNSSIHLPAASPIAACYPTTLQLTMRATAPPTTPARTHDGAAALLAVEGSSPAAVIQLSKLPGTSAAWPRSDKLALQHPAGLEACQRMRVFRSTYPSTPTATTRLLLQRAAITYWGVCWYCATCSLRSTSVPAMSAHSRSSSGTSCCPPCTWTSLIHFHPPDSTRP